ncbi:MAG: L-seryl-tRNA(Sec) selenium transferase [Bacillota bacterium]
MEKSQLYRLIPKVDDILENKKILDKNFESKKILKMAINTVFDKTRKEIKKLNKDELSNYKINNDLLIDKIIDTYEDIVSMNLKKVVNATGIVVHTNLGRSCINKNTSKEIQEIASSYSNLEFDLESGKRGHRYNHIEKLICQITGAQAAMVVNNNAAAVMLVLDTLARNKEAIVSRGELVEIGGSFRVPDVMKKSGTVLKEVGTTNKTHLEDYKNKINENTGILLKVHTSNYRVVGFSKTVLRKDLVELSKEKNVPVYEDLGSGLLFDFSDYINTDEPTVKEVVESGIDVISFSGDKMLGGPQAGIIVGKKKYIEKMKYNQLTRALRVDKMTLAALEVTLRQYLDLSVNKEKIPTIKNIIISKKDLNKKAKNLKEKLMEIPDISVKIIPSKSQVGGGSMPTLNLDSYSLNIKYKDFDASELSKSLRICKFPVVGRIKNENFLMDIRTIEDYDFDHIVNAFLDIGGKDV